MVTGCRVSVFFADSPDVAGLVVAQMRSRPGPGERFRVPTSTPVPAGSPEARNRQLAGRLSPGLSHMFDGCNKGSCYLAASAYASVSASSSSSLILRVVFP